MELLGKDRAQAADPTKVVSSGLHRQGGDAYGEICTEGGFEMRITISIPRFGIRVTISIKKAAKAEN